MKPTPDFIKNSIIQRLQTEILDELDIKVLIFHFTSVRESDILDYKFTQTYNQNIEIAFCDYLVGIDDKIVGYYKLALKDFNFSDSNGNLLSLRGPTSALRALSNKDLKKTPYYYSEDLNISNKPEFSNEDLKIDGNSYLLPKYFKFELYRAIEADDLAPPNVPDFYELDSHSKTEKLLHFAVSKISEKFDKKITLMWIPQPHLNPFESNKSRKKNHNSVIILLSKTIGIDYRYRIAKTIRDFIFQHTLDFYTNGFRYDTSEIYKNIIPKGLGLRKVKETKVVNLFKYVAEKESRKISAILDSVESFFKLYYDKNLDKISKRRPEPFVCKEIRNFAESENADWKFFVKNIEMRILFLGLYFFTPYNIAESFSIITESNYLPQINFNNNNTTRRKGKTRDINNRCFIKNLQGDYILPHSATSLINDSKNRIIDDLSIFETNCLIKIGEYLGCSNTTSKYKSILDELKEHLKSFISQGV